MVGPLVWGACRCPLPPVLPSYLPRRMRWWELAHARTPTDLKSKGPPGIFWEWDE